MARKLPKHIHVMRVLRSRILRGVYESRLPGQRILADELRTNPKTVVLALLKLEMLGLVRRTERSGTFVVPARERVRKAPGAYARLVLTVPVSDAAPDDFWASPVIYGFQAAAHEHEVSLSLEYTDDVDGIVRKAVAQGGLPECVGVCTVGLPLETGHVVELASSHGPVVVAESHVEEPLVPCVSFDNVEAGRLAAGHLVKLGHQRIAFVTYADLDAPPHADRFRGIDSLLVHIGAPLVAKETIHRFGSVKVLQSILNHPTNPTAVICANGDLARVLIELAADRGRRVPQGLSVLSLVRPEPPVRGSPSGIVMDGIGLGRRAFEMLLDEELMANPRRVLVPVKLFEGATTGPPPPE